MTWWLLGPALGISAIATAELFSIDSALGWGQLFRVGLGVCLFFLAEHWLHAKKLRGWAWALYGLSILGLVAVLLLGHGVKRWITVAGFALQPSELAKLAFVLVAARLLEGERNSGGALLRVGLVAFPVFALIFVEPDLATAATIPVVATWMLFAMGVAGDAILLVYTPLLAAITSFVTWAFGGVMVFALAWARFKYRKGLGYLLALLGLGLGAGIATPLIWQKGLKEYQRKRILAFVAPQKHESEAAWQSLQAKIALGSGGLFGKGLGKGTQKELEFLPAAHTDFIYAAVGEEMGLLGCGAILALFGVLFWQLGRAFFRFKDRFLKGFAAGVLGLLAFNAVFNILAVTGLFPVAGLPLPFASYGGSHILAEFFVIGAVAGALRQR